MKKYAILIVILFSIIPLFSEVFWSGYYETELNGYDFPQNKVLTNYHKFRLNLDTSPSRNIKIGGNMIYKHYGMDTEYNLMTFLPEKYRGLQSSSNDFYSIPNYNYSLKDTIFIDNLYFRLHHKYFDLILGKQQLPIGVGYAWNPLDIFNKKDIFDPTYENRGHNAFQLNIPISSQFSFTGIIQTESQFDNFTHFYELQAWLGSFDVSLVYAREKYDITTKFDLQERISQTSSSNAMARPLREIGGFSAEGELLGLGVRTEIAANKFENEMNDLKYEYIVGLDYTFTNSLYILTEFHHNDLGAKVNNTGLLNYLQYFRYEKKSVNKNYAFGMMQYPITDLATGSLSGIVNFDDRSVVINPELVYRIYQDVEITLMGNYFVGGQQDEFGYQKYGGRIRLRAYF